MGGNLDYCYTAFCVTKIAFHTNKLRIQTADVPPSCPLKWGAGVVAPAVRGGMKGRRCGSNGNLAGSLAPCVGVHGIPLQRPRPLGGVNSVARIEYHLLIHRQKGTVVRLSRRSAAPPPAKHGNRGGRFVSSRASTRAGSAGSAVSQVNPPLTQVETDSIQL